ncbi:MAG: 2-oxo acid dehydrogenase subunit E2 [Planctomycetota bacterium]
MRAVSGRCAARLNDRLGRAARRLRQRRDVLRNRQHRESRLPNRPVLQVFEVDLLGVWRTVRAALPQIVERRGQVVPADMVYLSFSFYHRVLDGSAAVTFGNAVIKHLQKPLELALDS